MNPFLKLRIILFLGPAGRLPCLLPFPDFTHSATQYGHPFRSGNLFRYECKASCWLIWNFVKFSFVPQNNKCHMYNHNHHALFCLHLKPTGTLWTTVYELTCSYGTAQRSSPQPASTSLPGSWRSQCPAVPRGSRFWASKKTTSVTVATESFASTTPKRQSLTNWKPTWRVWKRRWMTSEGQTERTETLPRVEHHHSRVRLPSRPRPQTTM